ncbi:MAG: chemotaxis protein CheW [Acidobacteriia bacterium]|nr:chemotaxis protein CheW [Terriglobia bacterium]
METTRDAIEQQQYLTFFLAGEEYAISILKVKEIIEYHTVTSVPKTPQWIRGVINLRGAVVPVVDLAVKFGIEERPVTRTTCIVIIEGCFEDQTATMGVIADAVSQVIDLSEGDIHEPPSFGTRVRVDYLLGVAPLGKKFALLLDVDRVLSSDDVLSLNEVPEFLSAAEPQGEISEEAVPPSSEPEQHAEA